MSEDIIHRGDFIEKVSVIELNPTELCNLKCNFCPRSTFYPNQNLHMSLETGEEIYSQMMDIKFTGWVSITGRGEPTLHPQFDKLSEIFQREEKTWKVKATTNGKNLKKWWDAMMKYDFITYSLYKETKQEYEKIKRKYSRYREEHTGTPPIDIKHRPYDMDWTERGNFTNRAGALEGAHVTRNTKCDVAFIKLFIDYDGTYRLCCEDWKDKISLGTIYDQNIGDYIEHNKKLKKIQRQLINGERSHNPCKDCSYTPDQQKYNQFFKDSQNIWQYYESALSKVS